MILEVFSLQKWGKKCKNLQIHILGFHYLAPRKKGW
jgi:hypothetical protein